MPQLDLVTFGTQFNWFFIGLFVSYVLVFNGHAHVVCSSHHVRKTLFKTNYSSHVKPLSRFSSALVDAR
jgi:hypothetical protein